MVGAVVGVAVYQGSRLKGQGLYVLCGTTAGGVAAIIIHAYARTIKLAEVTLSIPQFSNVKFAVTKDNKTVAWRLFVETVTRVSLQPLDRDSGNLREAMNSLYALFGVTRQVLAESQPTKSTRDTPTVEHLAITMLNRELRPFLALWHPKLKSWEREHPGQPEAAWPDDAACRSDLASMQQRLARYAIGFGELGGVVNVREIMGAAHIIDDPDRATSWPVRMRTPTSGTATVVGGGIEE
jgi:hypothetical protein